MHVIVYYFHYCKWLRLDRDRNHLYGSIFNSWKTRSTFLVCSVTNCLEEVIRQRCTTLRILWITWRALTMKPTRASTKVHRAPGKWKQQETRERLQDRGSKWDINDARDSSTASSQVHDGNDNQPFSLMEDIGFVRLFQVLEPRHSLPSRKYLEYVCACCFFLALQLTTACLDYFGRV